MTDPKKLDAETIAKMLLEGIGSQLGMTYDEVVAQWREPRSNLLTLKPTPDQIKQALDLLNAGECDIEKIAEAVGCQWDDFTWCTEPALARLADSHDWWLNEGQYEDFEDD